MKEKDKEIPLVYQIVYQKFPVENDSSYFGVPTSSKKQKIFVERADVTYVDLDYILEDEYPLIANKNIRNGQASRLKDDAVVSKDSGFYSEKLRNPKIKKTALKSRQVKRHASHKKQSITSVFNPKSKSYEKSSTRRFCKEAMGIANTSFTSDSDCTDGTALKREEASQTEQNAGISGENSHLFVPIHNSEDVSADQRIMKDKEATSIQTNLVTGEGESVGSKKDEVKHPTIIEKIYSAVKSLGEAINQIVAIDKASENIVHPVEDIQSFPMEERALNPIIASNLKNPSLSNHRKRPLPSESVEASCDETIIHCQKKPRIRESPANEEKVPKATDFPGSDHSNPFEINKPAKGRVQASGSSSSSSYLNEAFFENSDEFHCDENAFSLKESHISKDDTKISSTEAKRTSVEPIMTSKDSPPNKGLNSKSVSPTSPHHILESKGGLALQNSPAKPDVGCSMASPSSFENHSSLLESTKAADEMCGTAFELPGEISEESLASDRKSETRILNIASIEQNELIEGGEYLADKRDFDREAKILSISRNVKDNSTQTREAFSQNKRPNGEGRSLISPTFENGPEEVEKLEQFVQIDQANPTLNHASDAASNDDRLPFIPNDSSYTEKNIERNVSLKYHERREENEHEGKEGHLSDEEQPDCEKNDPEAEPSGLNQDSKVSEVSTESTQNRASPSSKKKTCNKVKGANYRRRKGRYLSWARKANNMRQQQTASRKTQSRQGRQKNVESITAKLDRHSVQTSAGERGKSEEGKSQQGKLEEGERAGGTTENPSEINPHLSGGALGDLPLAESSKDQLKPDGGGERRFPQRVRNAVMRFQPEDYIYSYPASLVPKLDKPLTRSLSQRRVSLSDSNLLPSLNPMNRKNPKYFRELVALGIVPPQEAKGDGSKGKGDESPKTEGDRTEMTPAECLRRSARMSTKHIIHGAKRIRRKMSRFTRHK